MSHTVFLWTPWLLRRQSGLKSPGISRGKAAVSDQDGLMCGQTLFGVKGYADAWNSDVRAACSFDFDTYIDLFLERVFS